MTSDLLLSGRCIVTDREEVSEPTEYLRVIQSLADAAAQIDLALYCQLCGQVLVMDDASVTLQMECGCRTFVGKQVKES